MSPFLRLGHGGCTLPPCAIEDNDKSLNKVHSLILNASFREELKEWINECNVNVYWFELFRIDRQIISMELCIYCWTVVFTVLLIML